MRAYLVVAAILAAAIACGSATAQAYRWVDDQGRVHYTQTPPPPGAKDVQRKNLQQSGASAPADVPYATKVAAKNFPVKLYTQDQCAPCDDARAVLVKRAVPFTEIRLTTQKEVDEVKTISGSSTVPLLVVGSLFQSGFQEQLANNLLDTAGYPSAGSRAPSAPSRPSAPPQPPPAAEPGAASKY
jgi:glutaredoxin